MILRNCKILQGDKELIVDILIEDGKITKFGHNIKHFGEEIDVNEKYVLPGLIDSHVHFRDFEQAHKEDWFSGSSAAAAGGITTVLDMPNNSPPIITIKQLEKKRMLAKKSIVNYGFHFGSTVDNIEDIKKAKNIASVKIYMNMTTGKLLVEDDDALDRIFAAAKMVSVHAEGDVVKKAIDLAKKHNTRLYLAHISQRAELDILEEEKTKNIFAEVTPHHLFLSEIDNKDAFTKMIPALKSVLDNEALMKAIKTGLIDTVGTDHAPHTVGEKLEPDPPAGVPGCETMLPLLLDAVNSGILTISLVQKLCCENPAKIFGIKNKGHIKPGYDADLVVVDMDFVKVVRDEELLTKPGWSPFDSRTLQGWPVLTIINGNIVFDGDVHDVNKGREVEYETHS